MPVGFTISQHPRIVVGTRQKNSLPKGSIVDSYKFAYIFTIKIAHSFQVKGYRKYTMDPYELHVWVFPSMVVS